MLAALIAFAGETATFLIGEGIESLEELEFAKFAHARSETPSVGIRGVQGMMLGAPQRGSLLNATATAHLPYAALAEIAS